MVTTPRSAWGRAAGERERLRREMSERLEHLGPHAREEATRAVNRSIKLIRSLSIRRVFGPLGEEASP